MDETGPRFYEVAELAAGADRDVVDMVSGEPDWSPPEAVRTGLEAYARRSVDEFQYGPSEGLSALRAEIAGRRGVDREAIIVTNGAGEANYLALAAALEHASGREVVAVDPVYPYYPAKTRLLGGTPRLVETTPDSGPPVADIVREIHAETAAIILNTPNNPTGMVYPQDALERIADAADAAGAWLISDEVYDHYDFSETFASGLALDSQRCIVTNAFSKSMAITGFRVGYGIVPPALWEPVRQRHLLVNVTGSRPAQAAVLAALEDTSPRYYRRCRERVADRIDHFTDGLADLGVPHVRPAGGFYVMAKFPNHPGTLETVESLITEAGVAAMPGDRFGSAADDWVRFSLTTSRYDTAIDRLRDWFGSN